MKKILSFVLALCMICTLLPATVLTASAADGPWKLVTDVTELKAGDEVVIVANGYDFALSTEQKSNNRGQAAVTKSGNTVTWTSSVQVLTLEAGTKSDTWAFNTGSGYLYAAHSSSNYLRTEQTLSDNSSWKITITSDGVATVIAQGTNTRNVMQYNQSSSLFACYSSASQKAISIYKQEASTAPAYTINANSNNDAYGTVELDGATIIASPADGYKVAGYQVISGTATVTQDGNEFTVEAASDCEIQINFVAREQATVSFIANGAVYTTKTGYVNDSIAMPEYEGNVTEGYDFVGWVMNEVEETTDSQEITATGKSYTLSDNVTFYALFARTEEGGAGSGNAYKKVTGALTTGNYIITYSESIAMSNAYESGKSDRIAAYTGLTVSDDVINDPDTSIIWTITVTDGTATLYSVGQEKYLTATSNSTTLKLDAGAADWTITQNPDDTYDFTRPDVSTTRAVRYNTTNKNFRFYSKSDSVSKQPLTLYKAANVTTYYTTSPAPVVEYGVVQYVPADGREAVEYISWDKAMAALGNAAGELVLLENLTVSQVNLNKDLVLNLNGCTLTADAIVATVKDSTDGEGLVKVAQGSAVLSSVDGQLLLWDNTNNASGYRAFSYTMDNMISGGTATEAEQEKGFTNIKTFWNVLRFTNTYAYTLVASEYSGLNTVTFTLEWGGVEKTFAFAAGDIVAWAKQEVVNINDDFGFYIRVTGFENVESGTLTVTAAVKSDCGTNEKTMVTTYEYGKV